MQGKMRKKKAIGIVKSCLERAGGGPLVFCPSIIKIDQRDEWSYLVYIARAKSAQAQ